MRLDEVGLLVGFGGLFGFTELLDQAHRLSLEAAVEAATGAGVDDVAELFGGEVEESIDGGVNWLGLGITCGVGRDCSWSRVLLCLELRGDGVVKTYWSRSMPRYENFRKVLFFLSSAASSAFCAEGVWSVRFLF